MLKSDLKSLFFCFFGRLDIGGDQMIVSVSKRTDVPALYMDWFMRRLQEGFAYSINPYNPKLVKKISLKKEDVDAFVFWSKYPKDFLTYVDILEEYTYYMQFTLTPYGKDLESGLPAKEELLDLFINLSKKIGKEKVIWRYDPIILTKDYTVKDQIRLFHDYCEKLSPYTKRVVISFVDEYQKNKKTFEDLGIEELSEASIHVLAGAFGKIASKFGLEIETCAEAIDLEEYGIKHTKCMDDDLIGKLGGKTILYEKDPYQRPSCKCTKSVDIGSYDTCVLGCKYCYAVGRREVALRNYKKHQASDDNLLGVKMDEEMKTHKKTPTLFD